MWGLASLRKQKVVLIVEMLLRQREDRHLGSGWYLFEIQIAEMKHIYKADSQPSFDFILSRTSPSLLTH